MRHVAAVIQDGQVRWPTDTPRDVARELGGSEFVPITVHG
jgi:hypothetical protein